MLSQLDQKRSFSGRRVLVTGGLGFIGSNLVIRLAELGAKVIVIDCRLPYAGANDYNVKPVRHQVEVIIGDIANRYLLKKWAADVDIIFNLASTLGFDSDSSVPFETQRALCQAHSEFFNGCRNSNNKPKIFYAASVAQPGRAYKRPVFKIPALPSASRRVGVDQTATEAYHRLCWGLASDGKLSVLRLGSVYGPRHQMQHPHLAVPNWFLRRLIDGDSILVPRSGQRFLDLLYVDDAVDALILAALSDATRSEAFNVSGTQIELRDLAELIVKLNGSGKIERAEQSKKSKQLDVARWLVSNHQVESELGWKAKTSLEKGFSTTLDYYRKSQAWYWLKSE